METYPAAVLLAVGAGAAHGRPWPAVVVGFSAVAAFGLVAARWAAWPADPGRPPRPSLGQRLGPPSWRFSDSWASNVTAVGAVLTAVVVSGLAAPAGRYVSPPGVAALAVFWGFLVVLAPFVYSATSSPVTPPGSPLPSGGGLALEGTVGAFLVSSAITVWAVLGQFATLALLVADLTGPRGVFRMALVVLVAAAAMLVRYAWCSILWVVEAQVAHEQRVAASGPAARPGWSIL